ncbi:MAG: glycosyltransferase family 39 protein [Lachnospiraceae bacterium]|nr:glycosyltransferase family 39 protein [Lachnospiraceae bacterium]
MIFVLLNIIVATVIPKKIKESFCKISDQLIVILTVIEVFVLIYMVYNYYFICGWDPGNDIYPDVLYVATGETELLHHYYFSIWPNNLFMVYIFSIVRKIDLCFGFLDVKTGYMGLLSFQSVIFSLVGFFTYKIARKVTNSVKTAWFAWLLYLCLVAVSPWLTFAYSDATGLLFPMLCVYLYLKAKDKGNFIYWGAIGLFGYFGYKIKPQTVFVLFSVLVIEFVLFFLNCKKQAFKELFKSVLKGALPLFVGIAIAITFVNHASNSMGYRLDTNKNFGWQHYLMMGLNDETDGACLPADSYISLSPATKEERAKVNLAEAKRRFLAYGAVGFLKHTAKKTLLNFDDGTFAWEEEGNFYKITFKDKNRFLSPMLKSIYYEDGKYTKRWRDFAQMCWIFCLTGIVAFFIHIWRKKENYDSIVFVMVLSLAMLTAFETLFEARARYLFTYAPVFICISMIGWSAVVTYLSRIVNARFHFVSRFRLGTKK